MGYRDFPMFLSTSQAVGADADSENFLDTELTVPGWERGMGGAVVINVETAPGGTTGVQFIIVHKTSEPTTGDAELIAVTVLNADLVAGSEIVLPLPGGVKLLRYMRLYYNLTSGDETSGVFSAYFMPLPLHSSP